MYAEYPPRKPCSTEKCLNYGITQLGLRSHPTGSSTLKALTTLSFIRSDKPVFNTPCSDPVVLVTLLRQWHIRNPYLTFLGRVHHFHRRLDPGLGHPHGGFSDCGCMDPFRTRAPHQCTGAHCGNIGPQSLGYSITGPSCFDCYRQYHCCSLHQKTRWDPFPPPVAAGSGSVSVASDSGHNSKSQTHSVLPKCDSRSPVSAKPAHHDRVESPPRSRESDIQTVGTPVVDRFATVHNTHLPQFMALVPEPRALAIDGEVNVHVSTVSPAQLSHSEAQEHPDWRGDTHRPLVAITTVVSTPATIQCGSPATILSVPQRPFVTTGLYLKRQVIPSARMEALMQHYQTAGFSREVSKFAAAPTCRSHSTKRMYDDRWLRFTTWGRGRGFDQTIKGYRSCLASVLSRMAGRQKSRLRLSQT